MTRIYIVDQLEQEKAVRLIRAGSIAKAAEHLIKDLFSIKAARPDDVASAMAAGVKVENAEEKQ